jgi:hypothetical protein
MMGSVSAKQEDKILVQREIVWMIFGREPNIDEKPSLVAK